MRNQVVKNGEVMGRQFYLSSVGGRGGSETLKNEMEIPSRRTQMG
ncbi:hypothetical protein [Metallosphaera javensis (ex Sakai et al. 2022)]|nr:MAG: hypothetical protein MjAS7_2758 [Metallosphaera javensis (ex Sakai et al. 2022)]